MACSAVESFDVSTTGFMPAACNIVWRATAAFASTAELVNSTLTEPFHPAAFAWATSDLAFSRSNAGPATPGSQGKLFWNSSAPVRPVPWYTRSFQVFASNAAAIDSPTLNDEIMNGPAPTGFKLKSQRLVFLVGSAHFLTAVGDGIMPGSDARA